jgi:hypothetical protein
MIIAAVFARILASDARWFAAFEETAHRFPCCDTLASLVAVRAYVLIDQLGVSGVDVDTFSMVPVVAVSIASDHPCMVIRSSANAKYRIFVFERIIFIFRVESRSAGLLLFPLLWWG